MKLNLKDSKILVTGGLGFIGTNLIIKLRKTGFGDLKNRIFSEPFLDVLEIAKRRRRLGF